MARRANDPNLLRAQAQNGREGENAWRQANAALTAQRQAAVQQAMQEAAMRGAPAAAVAQLQNRVAAPYNSAITNTTQMGAAFAGDMSARRGRMYDYNQAVLAARQLIPAQIQQTLAPIRAENRFQLQSLRQEGQNRVAEIEAQTALQLAQIRAEERLRQQAAEEAGLGSLTEGDLEAAVSQRALNILDPAAQGIAAAVTTGEQQARQAFRRRMGGARSDVQEAELQQASAGLYGTPGANLFEQRAAMLGQTPGYTNLAPGVDQASPSDIERYHQLYADLGQEDQPGTDYATTGPLFSGQLAEGSQFGQAESVLAGESTQTPGGFFASWNSNLGAPGAPGAPGAADTTSIAAPFDVTAFQNAIQGQTPDTGQMNQYREASTDAAAQLARIRGRGVQPLSPYGMLTEQQVQGLPDFAQGLVTQAAASGETFNTPEDVRRILFGKPEITIDRLTGQGTAAVSPYAADVKQAVMAMAAQQLAAQGYDITSPELANAIMSTPETLYDLAAGQTGQPTTPDLISQAEQEADRRKLSKEARIKTNRTDIEQQFRGQFKMPIPTNVGSVEDVAEAAFSPQFLATWDQLQQILAAAGWDMDYDEAISAAFAKAGGDPTAFTPFMRAVMKGMLP